MKKTYTKPEINKEDFPYQTLSELKQIVREPEDAYRIRLLYVDGDFEGVLAMPCSPEDKQKIDSGKSYDELAQVRLASHPFGWGPAVWGMEITVRTRGEVRAVGLLADQDKKRIVKESMLIRYLINKENKNEGIDCFKRVPTEDKETRR